jgi:hypothetical protein
VVAAAALVAAISFLCACSDPSSASDLRASVTTGASDEAASKVCAPFFGSAKGITLVASIDSTVGEVEALLQNKASANTLEANLGSNPDTAGYVAICVVRGPGVQQSFGKNTVAFYQLPDNAGSGPIETWDSN